MSYYNHMNDPEEHKSTCESCEKDFTWSEHGPFYQGNNEREFIKCPYCGEIMDRFAQVVSYLPAK